MSNINQAGDYRGNVLARGLSNSSGGHLQLELTLQATEKWDAEAQVWELWDYDEVDAQAYLNLVTSKEKGNAVNMRQLMRAFGWDGVSFAALQSDTKLASTIQWRMAEETYEGVERIKVTNIGNYDDPPGRAISQLSAADLRAVDAKYAGILRASGGGPKPTSARLTAPAPTPQAAPADPTPTVVESAPIAPAPATPVEPTKRTRGRPRTPPQPPAAPVAPSAAPATPAILPPTPTPVSQGDAWQNVYNKAHPTGKTDVEITNAWVNTVNKYGGDEKVGEDWGQVAAQTIEALGI